MKILIAPALKFNTRRSGLEPEPSGAQSAPLLIWHWIPGSAFSSPGMTVFIPFAGRINNSIVLYAYEQFSACCHRGVSTLIPGPSPAPAKSVPAGIGSKAAQSGETGGRRECEPPRPQWEMGWGEGG